MTQRFSSAAALTLALLMSNAAPAQSREEVAARVFAPYPREWGHYHPNRCTVWDGYQWLNMCWRSRSIVRPAWTRFHR
jgi:hypothetical protein